MASSLDLTVQQRQLHTGQQLYPTAPIYNMAFVFEVGIVDEERFQEAFQHLIARCDALRMVLRDGRQVTRTSIEAPLAIHAVDNPQAWATDHLQVPFDVELRSFQSALLRRPDGSHVWFIGQHHLFTDGWSFLVLYEQMAALYNGTSPKDLPSFADHCREQAERSASRDSPHWSRFPRTTSPAPLYGVSVARPSTRNRRQTLSLGVDRTQRLRALAMEKGIRGITVDVGLFQLFATAVFAWVRRVSGEHTLAIGAPSHNRLTPVARDTVGLFTEVFPMAVDLQPGETFRTLYGQVRNEANQYMRAAKPGAVTPAQRAHTGVVLNYIRGGFSGFQEGVSAGATWLHSGHVEPEHHARIHIHDFEKTGTLSISFDLNEEVLGLHTTDAPTHLIRLIDAMLADFDTPVDQVELLQTEATDVLALTDRRSPKLSRGILERFHTQVDENPEQIGLVEGSKRWTYAELDRLASKMASGIELDSVVGVAIGRSANAVLALLGVLKAGAAFLPIDPAWPANRRSMVIEDAGCTQILTAQDIPTSTVDAPSVRPDVAPNALAYVLYTSGSTGRPKGVRIEHSALATYVDWAVTTYGPSRSFPLFSNLAFDLTITSVFVPLASGGTIHAYPRRDRPTDLAVLEVFDDNQVDIVKLTPSHLGLLADRDLSSTRVRQLVLGGEALTTSLARRTTRRFPAGLVIHNEYGPTEATVGCVAHVFDVHTDTGPSVPIGRPIDGVEVRVVDDGGHVVPFGVEGELWIGGSGLARDYLGRPELTDTSFVQQDGRRFYRSGDRARLRPDGVLEYRGRIDEQVKIGGVRIELGEIEAALLAHPSIQTATAGLYVRHHHEVDATCTRCGMPSNYPGVRFDQEGVCGHCRAFEQYEHRAHVYFGPMTELSDILHTASERGAQTYDCLVLLSGGKDSSYMLGRLVDMGLRVLSYTLDNGFISDEAKANIKRITDTLGVDHLFDSTPAMNDIFVDSLQRHANVCQGCFKTIYTLSMKVAKTRGIPFIVTGLSRGQFFETRLTADLFTEMTPSSEQIDRNVLAARKAYHKVEDATTRLLDTSLFDDDQIFEDVQFVDFYRYCDVDLTELYAYLDTRLPWVRPTDTGRSTNCLINDVGIYVHQRVRGFHNYALPYSWDVRLGHKQRDAALEELDDHIEPERVQEILQAIGYPEDVHSLQAPGRLVAWYTSTSPIDPDALQDHLATFLTRSQRPTALVHLDELPLTPNGKVDRGRLPAPHRFRPTTEAAHVAPRSDLEVALANVWQEVLGVDRVGVLDDFYRLGGDSITAIQVVARARAIGIELQLAQVFEYPCIDGLAKQVVTRDTRNHGPVALTWGQSHLLSADQPGELVEVYSLPVAWSDEQLQQRFARLIRQHEALRMSFDHADSGWSAQVHADVPVPSIGTGPYEPHGFDLGHPPLLRASVLENSEERTLTLVAPAVLLDRTSWSILMDDWTRDTPKAPTSSLFEWLEASESSDSLPQPDHPAPRPARLLHAVPFELDADTSNLLHEQSPGWRVSVAELFTIAVAYALGEETGQAKVCLSLPSQGRASDHAAVDASRTLGHFSQPMRYTIDTSQAKSAQVLRTLKDDLRAPSTTIAGPESVGFRFDSHKAGSRQQGHQAWQPHALAVHVERHRDRMIVTWTGDQTVKTEKLERLSRASREHLEQWSSALQRGGSTVSATDFPLAGLDALGLDKLSALLGDS